MYTPAANRVDDAAEINAFIHAYGFASVITAPEGSPCASHLPVLFDETTGTLRGHIARANEQWRHLQSGQEMLCIFHGPHAYISPSWYASKVNVPTWNYAAVHVYGLPTVHHDADFLHRVVVDTTAKYEKHQPQPWTLSLPPEMTAGLLKAIVGFSIRITRIEAKFKLSQNKSAKDQAGMLAALSASSERDAQALAAFIAAQPPRP